MYAADRSKAGCQDRSFIYDKITSVKSMVKNCFFKGPDYYIDLGIVWK
jgi:hypothetical protein